MVASAPCFMIFVWSVIFITRVVSLPAIEKVLAVASTEAILPRKGVARVVFLVADFSIGEALAAGEAVGEGVAFDAAQTTLEVESSRVAIHVPRTNELLFFICVGAVEVQATLPAMDGRYLSFRYSAV